MSTVFHNVLRSPGNKRDFMIFFLVIQTDFKDLIDVLLNILQLVLQGEIKPSFEVFAKFHGINILTMANFNLPMWCHWTKSWKEISSKTLLYSILSYR